MSMKNDSENNNLFADTSFSSIRWLAEQMPGGFFVYSCAQKNLPIMYINHAACKIFGCDSVEEFRELTGNTFEGMVYPDDYQAVKEAMAQQIDDENDARKTEHMFYRIVRKDGKMRWIDDCGHCTTLPGYDDVYCVFINDVTDSKQMLREQEKNRLLTEALEDAKQANVAKMIFLSNMSHEIRTPITSILGMNDIIRSEFHDSALDYYTDSIHQAGTNLLGIINDILGYSKIENGKLEIVSTEYMLHDLVSNVYNMVQFRAVEKGLDINLEVSPDLPQKLFGDDLRIKQIISNLLTNAIKYTEKGSVTLRLYADANGLSEKSVHMYVAVEDTGIGIREEELNKIFEAFTRVDATRTHSIEGAGLGLSICRQLLERMGSKLCVKSRYNEGSIFSFVLKQKVVDETPIGAFSLFMNKRGRQSEESRSFTFSARNAGFLLLTIRP